ncbi:MAG: hypothetical protein ACO3TG_02660 [Minisyncoccia bacterium]
MKSIEFIPKNQKRLNPKAKKDSLIYALLTLLLLYTTVIGMSYWLFVLQEKNELTKEIEDLDANNRKYYMTNNLEQDLFNVANIISKFYDPVPVVQSIELSYVLGADISKFSYNKLKKSINISMTVPSINDITKQVVAFQASSLVKTVNTSAVTSQKDNTGFTFNIEILLK